MFGKSRAEVSSDASRANGRDGERSAKQNPADEFGGSEWKRKQNDDGNGHGNDEDESQPECPPGSLVHAGLSAGNQGWEQQPPCGEHGREGDSDNEQDEKDGRDVSHGVCPFVFD